MKRIIAAIFVFLLAAGCNEEEPYVNFLSESLASQGLVSASVLSAEKVKLDFPSAGGSASVPFMATAAWSVRLDSDWCTVSPMDGDASNGTSVTVTATPNLSEAQRSCTVTITCGEVNRYIAVAQEPAPTPEPDKFFLSPSAVDIGPAGGIFTVTVTSTQPYHISAVPEWIKESSVSGTTHSFNAEANDSKEERSGVIVFCSDEGACLPCTVTQAGNGPYTAIGAMTMEFSGEAGSKKMAITSNESWTVSSDAPWCSVSPASGSGNADVIVAVEENETVVTRNCVVTVVSESGISKQLSVAQYGADIFVVNPTELQIGYDACRFDVSVVTPRQYTVSVEADWIAEYTEYGGVHTFQASANPSTAERSAVILFTDKDGEQITCTVTQEGAPSFVTADISLIDVEEEEVEKTFKINSNDSWTVTADAPWCHITPSSGSGDASVAVRIESNPETTTRRCNISVTTAGGAGVVIMVKQSRGYQNVDWAADFYHRSLFMRFTATWCVWCPVMHETIVRAMEMYPDKLVPVALHVNSSDLAFSSCSPLSSQFYVSGIPTGIVDARINIPNKGAAVSAPLIIDASKETESVYGTNTGLEISSVLSGRDLSIDLTVYAKKSGDYKLTVLLLEDGIYYSQTGTESGYMIHDDVARIAVTNVSGDSFYISKPNYVKTFFLTAKNIPESYDITKMKILAYVQMPFGSSPRKQSANYGDYYVDNSVVVPFGETLSLQMAGSVSGGQGEGIWAGDDIDM